ncbi:MAG: metallopeptidase family protein [Syntrophomonadaceae bacterium]|nr:metallopeptidase family protein [Syntrophomonadaceae bacterium]
MVKPSFDKFTDMLDQAVNCIPPRFCRELTGGFNVQKRKKREGEYYILGEYVEGGHLGCFIVFYYGSFVELLKDEPEEVWEAEIMDTVLHEMQHHLEALAGREDLARKEIAELAQALREG